MTSEPADTPRAFSPHADEPATDRQAAEVQADGLLSYEAARDQLVAVVQQLESGGSSLQESVALWERGERLADVCQRWLDGARARLEAAIDRDA